jgi:hypothetical protein
MGTSREKKRNRRESLCVFFGDKMRAGPPLVGVFWEGTHPTCQSTDFVAKKNTGKSGGKTERGGHKVKKHKKKR